MTKTEKALLFSAYQFNLKHKGKDFSSLCNLPKSSCKHCHNQYDSIIKFTGERQEVGICLIPKKIEKICKIFSPEEMHSFCDIFFCTWEP